MTDTPRPHIALLLAGGQGRRANTVCPKQFVEVGGRSVLAHTAAQFQSHAAVDAFHVVCTETWRAFVEGEMAAQGYTKFGGTFPAGATSIDSLRSGVEGLQAKGFADDTVVLVHEAVRPLVSAAVIADSIAVCERSGSAIAGLESHESYMQSGNGVQAINMLPRYGLFRAQTPQTFPLGALRAAFDEADRRGIHTSQSLYTLMAELGRFPLCISRGEHANMKLTYPADLRLFEALIRGGYDI